MKNKKNTEIFSVKLRALMSLKRCRGIDLAKKLKVRPATISGWRNGDFLPEPEKWAPLSEALGVTVPELFKGYCAEINYDKTPESNELLEQKKLYSQSDFLEFSQSRIMKLGSDFKFSGGSGDKLIRGEIEEDLKYYLDEAEKAGALSVAALKIRQHLDTEEFKLLKERLKK